MSKLTNSRTKKGAGLEGAVRDAVQLMQCMHTQLAAAASLEDPRRGMHLKVLEDAMKTMVVKSEELSSTFLGEPAGWLDGLEPRYLERDDKLMLRVKAQHVTRQVKNALVKQMQDEAKELRRRLAAFEEGGKTLAELEEEDRQELAAQVQRMEDQIVAQKEYSALVHRDVARTSPGFRHFTSRLEHALGTLRDNLERLEKRSKDSSIHRAYGVFLDECRRILSEAAASKSYAKLATSKQSPTLRKAIRDGINVAAVSLMLHLHGRIVGCEVVATVADVEDVEARVGDLESQILASHDNAKLQGDKLRHSLADTKKCNGLLKEKLEVYQNHAKELQNMIDELEKRGEWPSEDSP